MGMSDKPKPFNPFYKAVRDDVNGKYFADCLVRSCPHPSVIKKYGTGGVANVSVYTCRKCRHKKEYQFHGGVSCAYDEK